MKCKKMFMQENKIMKTIEKNIGQVLRRILGYKVAASSTVEATFVMISAVTAISFVIVFSMQLKNDTANYALTRIETEKNFSDVMTGRESERKFGDRTFVRPVEVLYGKEIIDEVVGK